MSLSPSLSHSFLPDAFRLRNVSLCMLWQLIRPAWLSDVSVAADDYQPYLVLINLQKEVQGSYS